MTGATSGLGKVSAIQAAKEGATLIVLARNQSKGQSLISEYRKQYPKAIGTIEVIIGDLASFDSIHHACQEVLAKYPVIDMIVNNAGIMNFEHQLSVDKIEETLQVNLLAPLLICHLLFEPLKKSTSGKIIFTSSGLHQGEINFDNLEFKDTFSSYKVYRQSKLGLILISRLVAELLQPYNIGIYTQHPGMVRTELGRSAGWLSRMIFYLMGTTPEKGAQTLSYLIEADQTLLTSGEYYANKKVTKTTPQSYDMTVAQQLLEVVNQYLGPYIPATSPFC